MVVEQKFDFLKRIQVVHKPDRRDVSRKVAAGELEIDNSWKIAMTRNAGKLIRRAASDFQDYLFVSMGVSVPVVYVDKAAKAANTIMLTTVAEYGRDLTEVPEKRGSFFFDGDENGILICGVDERSVFYGTIHLEDKMNMTEAPCLKMEKYLRTPLTRMRSTHSGSGIDDFPDSQLNAIVHAGFNAIDIFIKAPNLLRKGPCDVNDIIDRAESYGLDVVLYSYLSSYKHPDDADCEAFFDSVYGEVFRRHPKAAALHLVGESLQFPSKDPHTSGKRHNESVVDGIPDTRPSPGWYPCYDYPAYIQRIVTAVHNVKPEAEIILNTYNWGYTPAELRKAFLEKVDKNVTIHVTYDIFKTDIIEGLTCPVMDYSISADVPGSYFTSEVKAAHEVGFKNLRVTSNLAGASWDFGSAPYAPVPFRWLTRMNVLKDYLQYGVTSFYDDHHYGWWPNPCIDMAKEIFASNGETDIPALLKKVAARDYGAEVADDIVSAWKIWSDSMDYYVGTNEDQYGPWRTGPAYPFIFQPNISRTMRGKEIQFPCSAPGIIKTFYTPYENENQTPGPLRNPVEVKRLKIMLKMWNEGLELIRAALDRVPAKKREEAERLYALGKFVSCSINTTINIKRWWVANLQLQIQTEREPMLKKLDEIEAIAAEEIANVNACFEAVRADSRIGWEPSMEYVCDEWHLNWKLRQMESAKREIAAYRKMVLL